MRNKNKIRLTIICGIILVVILCTILIINIFNSSFTSEDEVIDLFNTNTSIFNNAAVYILDRSYENLSKDNFNGNSQEVNFLFTKADYEFIHKTKENFVYFVRDADFQYGQGLIYSKNKEEPLSNYITFLERIDDHWFFFKSK